MFDVIAPETRASILDQRAAYLHQRDASLTRLTENLNVENYGGAVIAFLKNQIRSELSWIQRLKRRVPRLKPAPRTPKK